MYFYLLIKFLRFLLHLLYFFFFNDTATTEIYTLSLHDALPISRIVDGERPAREGPRRARAVSRGRGAARRSEEHTSELQSRRDLVCRLLLEKKNINDFVLYRYKKQREYF